MVYRDMWNTGICAIRGYVGYKDTWDTRSHWVRRYVGYGDTWDTVIGAWDTRIWGYEDMGIYEYMWIQGVGYRDTEIHAGIQGLGYVRYRDWDMGM